MKRRPARTYATRAVLAAIALCVLLVAVPAATGVWAIGRSQAVVADQITTAQQAVARTLASQIDQALGFADSLARAAAHRPGLVQWTVERSREQQLAVLGNVFSTSDMFHALAVFDLDGNLLVDYPVSLYSSPGQVATDSSPAVFPARAIGDDAVLPVREPMSTDGQAAVAILVAELSLAKSVPDILSFRLGSTGTATVVVDDGRVLLAGEARRRGKSFTNPQLLETIASRQEGDATYYGNVLGRREVAFYAPLDHQQLGVVVSQAEEEAFAAANGLRSGLIIGISGAAGVALLISTLGVLIVARLVRRLHDEGARLNVVLDNTSAIVHMKDPAGRYSLVNRQFENVFGIPAEKALGKRDRDFFPEAIADFIEAHDRQALTAGTTMAFEEVVELEDGPHTYLVTRVPLSDEDGSPYALCSVAADITDRIRFEEEVNAARRDAENANLAKSEFLSRMSHELRTPLNSIIGFAQLLDMGGLADNERDSVKHILKGGRHLLDLINEVLDIARIEAGRLSLSLEPVPVASTLTEVVDLIGPLAASRKVEMITDGCGDCNRHVMADRQRLLQVLLNLLNNAIKYNKVGGQVTVCCHPDTDERLRISIIDTGVGIPDHLLGRIFTPFDRLGADATEEGTGLGLVLSRNLVEAMGGSMTVDTVVGQGSTFTINLPLATSPIDRLDSDESIDYGAQSQDDGASRRVLYIEDNLSNFALVQRILEYRPSIVLMAAMQGSLGLELARQHPPDLILLDLDLPDLPGRDVLSELRLDQRTAATPILIVSADANPRQIQRLRDAGATGYLTKPLDVVAFLEAVDTALAGKNGINSTG